MSKQLVHVFEPGVSGKQVLESLKSSDKEFACYSAECAPPPAGSGGSSSAGSSAARKVLSAARKSGGGTFNPKALMRSVTSGYVVSEQPQASFSKPLKSLTESDIDSWMGKNDAILKKPGNNVGVWHDTESGQVWLDVVRVYPNTSAGKSKAISSGVKHNQIAIFHLDSMTEVNTGGSGQVMETLIAACHSAACAPPPAGSGGSDSSGSSGSVTAVSKGDGSIGSTAKRSTTPNKKPSMTEGPSEIRLAGNRPDGRYERRYIGADLKSPTMVKAKMLTAKDGKARYIEKGPRSAMSGKRPMSISMTEPAAPHYRIDELGRVHQILPKVIRVNSPAAAPAPKVVPQKQLVS